MRPRSTPRNTDPVTNAGRNTGMTDPGHDDRATQIIGADLQRGPLGYGAPVLPGRKAADGDGRRFPRRMRFDVRVPAVGHHALAQRRIRACLALQRLDSLADSTCHSRVIGGYIDTTRNGGSPMMATRRLVSR